MTRATFPRAGIHPKHLSSRRLTMPPRDSAVSPRLSGHLAHRRSRPRPGWSPLPTLAGLQICQRRATDSLSKAVYVSEQVCITWRSTGAYYTAKLTFSHDLPIKVWDVYCTSVRIIFKFLWYSACSTFQICILNSH